MTKMNLEKLIHEKRGTIVDVRSRAEFNSGSAVDAINIPLTEIEQQLEEIKKLKTPLILCCASGNRSGIASQILAHKGVASWNAGSWFEVNKYQSQIL